MKKAIVISFFVALAASFGMMPTKSGYEDLYSRSINELAEEQKGLIELIKRTDGFSEKNKNLIKTRIEAARLKLKNIDFWLRYLEPISYKQINGPLPVEWENEVFEKFEKAYKREGAGLTLAELYLDEENIDKDSLAQLVRLSNEALKTYSADSITKLLEQADHFFLCNRLYLLNLAAIYTTGFECPNNDNIIPELRAMLAGVRNIYLRYNEHFAAKPLTTEYLELYDKMTDFVKAQPGSFEQFDHFRFIRDYVNPLFSINQKLIRQYHVRSQSFNDYSLDNECPSIFDKSLYRAQNTLGIYSLVTDAKTLAEIKAVGKLLFYDPILSGNNARSCVSCHKPNEYFTDTSFATSLQMDSRQRLQRNTPSLINVVYNHLLMLDGKQLSLHKQAEGVMTSPEEMGGSEKEIVAKVLSCKEYNAVFKKLVKLTPELKEITLEHIISTVTYYYGDFSNYYSPFDEAMNHKQALDMEAVKGFNLFMSKGKCATCHFVPQFNGVPPPYVSSEFEVLGTPADTGYKNLSSDKGRYNINPAAEMLGAFRTGTIRNAEHTKPYMHNGVFNTLDQVLDFYDAGGGAGRKLKVSNQSLPSDSLKLNVAEKKELLQFISSLNEKITFDTAPQQLPRSSKKELNGRKVGGDY